MESVQLFYEFSLVFGIVITAIILLLLAKKQQAYLHQRLLLAFFTIIFALFLNHYAAYHQIYWLYVGTNFLAEGTGFLIGPLIYFYIRSLFTKVDLKKTRAWLPFIPFLLVALFISLPLSFKDPREGLVFNYLKYYFEYGDVFYVLDMVYLLVFTLLSLKILRQYTQVIKRYFSNLTAADIIWSKRLLLGVILYLVIDTILLISGFQFEAFPLFDNQVNLLTILSVVVYLGYYGFFQAQMLIPTFLLETRGTQVEQQSNKIISSRKMTIFSTEEIASIKLALNNALAAEQLFLNESLTLSNLANHVQLTDKKLSTFINQELTTNFYELINQYRLAAFKKELILPENQHLTIWGIASECGFNSKTSFNRIFKKQTGLTPSQYQKQLKNR